VAGRHGPKGQSLRAQHAQGDEPRRGERHANLSPREKALDDPEGDPIGKGRKGRGLLVVLGAAVALVFVVLCALHESFAAPLAILAMDLFAGTAVFSGLWWTGTELNISAMMGLTMIVGISSEAAVFFLSQWQESSARVSFSEALVQGGQLRFRPIVMTALAAMLALAPLALGIGRGAAMLRPLAIAIIAGLVLTLPAVLLLLPVLFSLLSRSARGSDRS
jgi:multidrug efflux pump subunit AcrB